MTAQDKETDYVSTLASNANTNTSSPRQALIEAKAFSNIGLCVGLTYNLGK